MYSFETAVLVLYSSCISYYDLRSSTSTVLVRVQYNLDDYELILIFDLVQVPKINHRVQYYCIY
jgi:hypothetical protein